MPAESLKRRVLQAMADQVEQELIQLQNRRAWQSGQAGVPGAVRCVRLHELTEPVTELLKPNQASLPWKVIAGHPAYAPRPGVSVVADVAALIAYMRGRSPGLANAVLVELEGIRTDAEDFDGVESGAFLVRPTKILSVRKLTADETRAMAAPRGIHA